MVITIRSPTRPRSKTATLASLPPGNAFSATVRPRLPGHSASGTSNIARLVFGAAAFFLPYSLEEENKDEE